MPADPTPTPPDRAPGLGQCLIDMSPDPEEVGRLGPEHFPPDTDLAELARATPYAQRLTAITDRLAVTGGLTIPEAMTLAKSASTNRHLHGSAVEPVPCLGYLLLVGIECGALDIDDAPGGSELIFPGPNAADVRGHPLAVVGESIAPALLGDAEEGVLRVTPASLARELRLIPGLLYDLLLFTRTLDLRVVTDALHAEARTIPALRRCSRRRMEGFVATVRGLFVELGLATWTPGPGARLGQLDITPLGCFAVLLWRLALDGLTPELDQLIRDNGYLPCDGGYVRPADLPVPLSMN